MGDYNRLDGILEIPLTQGSLFLSQQLTYRIKAKYESWLELTARKRLFKIKEDLDAMEFKASMQAVQEAVGAGTFCWGGDAWLASINQAPGMVKLVMLLAESADAKMKQSQGLTEAKIWEILQDKSNSVASPKGGTESQLTLAIRELMNSQPNFMSPPTEGED